MNKKISIAVIIIAVAVLATLYIYKNNSITSMTNEDTTENTTANPSAATDNANPEENKVAEVGDLVVVNYTGTLENGTKFDSSYDRGQPFPFLIGKGMVIKGWDEGLMGVKRGDKKHLVIPGDKAYGDQEIKGPDGKVLIPKNATLVFDIEIVQVISAAKVEEMMKQQQAMKQAEQEAAADKAINTATATSTKK